ncbi:MAG: DNA mismatch repair protein MutS, partial [Planctomycetota bacterium]|nr:DNA mismatch repair protein MutS [Planctomycetota bacterium]
EHPDSILLFRMGDFYEMFYEDAQTASNLLQITLTTRGKGTDHAAPMCGFPYHQLSSYTAKLVERGRRVAVCEQVEDPKRAKGLVKREVVQVVSPGTLTDPAALDDKANRWIAAVARTAGRWGASFADLSTGEWLVWENGSDDPAALIDRLRAFRPCEIVHAESIDPRDWNERAPDVAVLHSPRPDFDFTPAGADDLLKRQFGVGSLDGFGLRGRTASVAAGGGLLAYLRDTQRSRIQHFDRIQRHEPERRLHLDPATRRNLELDAALRDGDRRYSLFHVLDATLTPGGARLLRRWMHAPLLDLDAIHGRLDAVQEFLQREDRRTALREVLRGVRDVERLLGRCVARTAHARDLRALATSLGTLPEVQAITRSMPAGLLGELSKNRDLLEDLQRDLDRGIAEEPPASLKDGGFIREGWNEELDGLRALARDGKRILAELETRERERTGISSLKIKYNKVFGYFLEVSKSNLARVPEDYERKQTLVNAERFVTAELKTFEEQVLTAEERSRELETDLFAALRERVAAIPQRLKEAASYLAQLDVLSTLAEAAAEEGWTRPRLDASRTLAIEGGRHPVVERTLVDRRFVPNDGRLDGDGDAIAILTGPNMGGKSTYLRQTGLIVLMAQMGSFVPAEAAHVGLVDRIFCRVGASDHLAEGQSTFMVEMTETANILHHAGAGSLVLLDEIGRGTATFDGLSIAWAVVERLHESTPTPPRTLFATHYHELTELAVEWRGVRNLRMTVKEWGDDVVFLHRVEEGAADRSYGIQVARLAGMPTEVVSRAADILETLEREEFDESGRARRGRLDATPAPRQARLFERPATGSTGPPRDPAAAEILAELRASDPARTTPIEALERLDRWRRRLKGVESNSEGDPIN